ncbi:MAG TPA: ABC transporter ATP-binding protein [Planctomycetota bacterium]|nr:ABC transporter ATP-binding protein [Planctomycetota bacterium]
MSEALIEIEGLEKSYGKQRALAGLTLSVAPGPVGLLGPNGSGKTTLIKLLLGLLRPDAGRARIAGLDPNRRADRLELRRAVGYMPESDCLIPGMTGVEIVGTLGRLSGMSAADAMTRAHEVLDYVGIEEARYRALDEYSTGMKQRLKLAQALVHDPKLLLLDEPTNGLDPKGRKHMLDLIADLGSAQEKNVLLCSHLLPDVERTCRDVVVLQRGNVVLSGAIAEMTRVDGRRSRVEVHGDEVRFAAELERTGHVVEARREEHVLIVRLPQGVSDADELFAIAARSGARLVRVSDVRASLEEVFMAGLTRDEAS